MQIKKYPDIDITIYGTNTVGTKSDEFISKTNLLRKLGFNTTPKTILSYDIIKPIIETGGVSNDVLRILCQIINNQKYPFMLRLSAEADARGTGIYASKAALPLIDDIKKTLLEVVSSYNSNDAIEFRRINNLSEGAGVIIEPIIGEILGRGIGYYYGPLFSGMGYTSTLKGDAYINISPGMFGGVSSRPSIKITKTLVDAQKNNFQKILKSFLRKERKGGDDFYAHEYFLETFEGHSWGQQRGIVVHESSSPMVNFFDYERNSFGANSFFSTYNFSEESKLAMRNIKLDKLFEKMNNLELQLKKPQYIEFALTNNKKDIWWINQIADVNEQIDLLEFRARSDALIEATNVVGNGIKQSNLLLDFSSMEHDEEILYDFNKTHSNYVLILDFHYVGFEGKRLGFGYYSNASTIFIVDSECAHMANSLESHLGGAVKVSGKLAGIINENDIFLFHKKNTAQKLTDYLYEGSFEVIGHEPLDKLILSLHSH